MLSMMAAVTEYLARPVIGHDAISIAFLFVLSLVFAIWIRNGIVQALTDIPSDIAAFCLEVENDFNEGMEEACEASLLLPHKSSGFVVWIVQSLRTLASYLVSNGILLVSLLSESVRFPFSFLVYYWNVVEAEFSENANIFLELGQHQSPVTRPSETSQAASQLRELAFLHIMIKGKNAVIKQLRADKVLLWTKSTKSEQIASTLRAESQRKDAQLASLDESFQIQEEALNQELTESESKDEEISKLKNEKVRLSSSLAAETKERESFSKRVTEEVEARVKAREEASQLRTRCNDQEGTISRLTFAKEKAEKRERKAREEREEARRRRDALAEDLDDLRREYAELKKRLETTEESVSTDTVPQTQEERPCDDAASFLNPNSLPNASSNAAQLVLNVTDPGEKTAPNAASLGTDLATPTPEAQDTIKAPPKLILRPSKGPNNKGVIKKSSTSHRQKKQVHVRSAVSKAGNIPSTRTAPPPPSLSFLTATPAPAVVTPPTAPSLPSFSFVTPAPAPTLSRRQVPSIIVTPPSVPVQFGELSTRVASPTPRYPAHLPAFLERIETVQPSSANTVPSSPSLSSVAGLEQTTEAELAEPQTDVHPDNGIPSSAPPQLTMTDTATMVQEPSDAPSVSDAMEEDGGNVTHANTEAVEEYDSRMDVVSDDEITGERDGSSMDVVDDNDKTTGERDGGMMDVDGGKNADDRPMVPPEVNQPEPAVLASTPVTSSLSAGNATISTASPAPGPSSRPNQRKVGTEEEEAALAKKLSRMVARVERRALAPPDDDACMRRPKEKTRRERRERKEAEPSASSELIAGVTMTAPQRASTQMVSTDVSLQLMSEHQKREEEAMMMDTSKG